MEMAQLNARDLLAREDTRHGGAILSEAKQRERASDWGYPNMPLRTNLR